MHKCMLVYGGECIVFDAYTVHVINWIKNVIKYFWDSSNTELWVVCVEFVITAVSTTTVLDMDRSINYEQLSQFTT